MLICVAIIVAVSVISIILIKTHPIQPAPTEEESVYKNPEDADVEFDWDAWRESIEKIRNGE